MRKVVVGVIAICVGMQMHAGSEFKMVSAGNGVVRCGAGPALKKLTASDCDREQGIEMEVIGRAKTAAPDFDLHPEPLYRATIGTLSRAIVAERTASSPSACERLIDARQFPIIFGKPMW